MFNLTMGWGRGLRRLNLYARRCLWAVGGRWFFRHRLIPLCCCTLLLFCCKYFIAWKFAQLSLLGCLEEVDWVSQRLWFWLLKCGLNQSLIALQQLSSERPLRWRNRSQKLNLCGQWGDERSLRRLLLFNQRSWNPVSDLLMKLTGFSMKNQLIEIPADAVGTSCGQKLDRVFFCVIKKG